jgi:SAM-dependent methyltransferase
MRGLAQHLPVRDACCDLVVAVTMLCFVAETEVRQAVREMARVLKPGGRLVLGELSPWSLWAARRRVRGWLGSSLWRGARFHGPGQLRSLAAGAGLEIHALRGAVYYPPWWWAARLLARWDHLFSRLTNLGAAFLVLAADKPTNR